MYGEYVGQDGLCVFQPFSPNLIDPSHINNLESDVKLNKEHTLVEKSGYLKRNNA